MPSTVAATQGGIDVTVERAPDSFGVRFGNDPTQMPWSRFLNEVSGAGYRMIELSLYGYLRTEALLGLNRNGK